MNLWDGIMLTGPFFIMGVWAMLFKYILHADLSNPVCISALATAILTFELLVAAIGIREDY